MPRPPVPRFALALLLVAACGGPARTATTTTIPADGVAAPALLVTLPDDPTAPPLCLAADAHHMAWTSSAGIVVADQDGRGARTLVPGVFPDWMAIAGPHLRFRGAGADGDALTDVALAGGPARPVAAGAAGPRPAPDEAAAAAAGESGHADADDDDDDDVRLADDRGQASIAPPGAAIVVTDRAGGLPRLILPPPASMGWLVRPPALLPDAIIAGDLDRDGATRIWRLPRDTAGAPVLLGRSAGSPRELAAVGGDLYLVEDVVDDADDDVTAPPRDRLVRIDRDGHRVELDTSRTIVAVAADPRGVAYATTDDEDRASIWLAEAGHPARRVVDGLDDELVGLALAPRSLYWIAGGTIWTASRTGGRPTRFHHPEWGDAGGNGRVHLVIDGATVYFSSVGLGATGVFRTRGGVESTELWPPPDEGLGDELVQVGGALFLVAGGRAIWRVPMDGTAPRELYGAGEDGQLVTIAGGGGWLYAAVGGPGGNAVVALDPASGAVGATMPTVVALDALAADDTAVYLGYGHRGWIVRAPHPPHPAAPP